MYERLFDTTAERNRYRTPDTGVTNAKSQAFFRQNVPRLIAVVWLIDFRNTQIIPKRPARDVFFTVQIPGRDERTSGVRIRQLNFFGRPRPAVVDGSTQDTSSPAQFVYRIRFVHVGDDIISKDEWDVYARRREYLRITYAGVSEWEKFRDEMIKFRVRVRVQDS